GLIRCSSGSWGIRMLYGLRCVLRFVRTVMTAPSSCRMYRRMPSAVRLVSSSGLSGCSSIREISPCPKRKGRAECWDVAHLDCARTVPEPLWKMELSDGHNAAFPLVDKGHVLLQPPFFRELGPSLQTQKMALGNEHVVLLTCDGKVLTWGAGRHGLLGHGDVEDVSAPRLVEALHGVTMSEVAAGGWHTVAVSESGDLYCWGWNESGQLGLPSKTLQVEERLYVYCMFPAYRATLDHPDFTIFSGVSSEEGPTGCDMDEDSEFIGIQAFPALIDLLQEIEAAKVSCGSRHTAAATRSGELFTWGWGKYGQLGHGDTKNLDQPKRVEFFYQNKFSVTDVAADLGHLVDNLVLSQEEAQCFANRRRSVGSRLRVGDLVWFSPRHVPMKVSSPKFKPRFIGPYKISEIINPVSFRLALPASFAIHSVFHRSLLRKYVVPVVPSVDPLAPVLVDGELEYVVEKILDSRFSRRRLQYLVKWKGYGQEDNSWVFASDVHAADLVRAFHLARPDRPGGSAEHSPDVTAVTAGADTESAGKLTAGDVTDIRILLFFCFSVFHVVVSRVVVSSVVISAVVVSAVVVSAVVVVVIGVVFRVVVVIGVVFRVVDFRVFNLEM
ncbi:unnamed protein product, partial [Ranitomeya imitator]